MDKMVKKQAKASEHVDITPAEMKKKLERFALMAKGSQLNLAIYMIEGSEDPWFFEALLAESSISEGYLLPGQVLEKAGKAAELLGLIALVNKPPTAKLSKTLNKIHVKLWNIKKDYLEHFATHVLPKAPWISSFTSWYNFISLYGLTSLSVAAAEALAKHNGNVNLHSLTSLSAAAAEALSKHKGQLNLNGLTSLSNAAADALSKHKGVSLELNGLTSLSAAAAEALSKHKGVSLELNGLTSLSNAAADALSNHKESLSLHGLTSLSDAVAQTLSKHKGWLTLNGLKSLSDTPGHLALAKKLCKGKTCVWLEALANLSDAAAKVMAGKIDIMERLLTSICIKNQIKKHRKK